MSKDRADAADVVWATGTLTPQGVVLYHDRPLTAWEWVKVKVLRRPDPRILRGA